MESPTSTIRLVDMQQRRLHAKMGKEEERGEKRRETETQRETEVETEIQLRERAQLKLEL